METKLNIGLISTHSPKHQGDVIHEPLGIQILSGYIKKNVDNVDVKLFDTQLSSQEEIFSSLMTIRPGIIGISVRPGTLKITTEIVNGIRELIATNLLDKDTIVVLGGNMPSINPNIFIKECPDTFIGVQEGEYVLKGLIEYYRGTRELEQIPNLVYKLPNGKIIHTKKHAFSMDDWEAPDRQLTQEFLKRGGVIWAEGATRSCDKHCVFCSIHKFHKSNFQSGNVNKVAEDLKNLESQGVQTVHFSDDEGWTDDMKTIMELAKLIIKEKINIKWTISTRVDKIVPNNVKDEEQQGIIDNIKVLQQSGLSRLFLGVESGSDVQLERYRKDISADQNEKAIHILDDLGVSYVAGFITFDYLMHIDELKENVAFLRKTGLYKNITNPFSIIRIHDGTGYKGMLKKEGLLGEISPDEPLLYTARFKDPKVGEIADIVDLLTNTYYEKIFAIKSKSQIHNSGDAPKKLNEIREQDMLILEKLIAGSEEGVLTQQFISELTHEYISKIEQIFDIE